MSKPNEVQTLTGRVNELSLRVSDQQSLIHEVLALVDEQAELLSLLYEKLGFRVQNVPQHKKVVKRK